MDIIPENGKKHPDNNIYNNGSFSNKSNKELRLSKLDTKSNLVNTHTSSVYSLHEKVKDWLKSNGVVDDPLFNCQEVLPSFEDKKYKHFCCSKLCPICHQRKAKDILKKYKKVENILSNSIYSTQLATIHFHDVEENNILPMYEYIAQSFSRLANDLKIKKYVSGMIKAIELSTTDTGLFHIHVHILFAYNRCIYRRRDFYKKPQNDMRLMHISSYISKFFDGKNIKHYKQTSISKIVSENFNHRNNIFFSTIRHTLDLNKIISYMAKVPSDIEPQEWITWKNAITNKKALTATGIFRKSLQKISLQEKQTKQRQ